MTRPRPSARRRRGQRRMTAWGRPPDSPARLHLLAARRTLRLVFVFLPPSPRPRPPPHLRKGTVLPAGAASKPHFPLLAVGGNRGPYRHSRNLFWPRCERNREDTEALTEEALTEEAPTEEARKDMQMQSRSQPRHAPVGRAVGGMSRNGLPGAGVWPGAGPPRKGRRGLGRELPNFGWVWGGVGSCVCVCFPKLFWCISPSA